MAASDNEQEAQMRQVAVASVLGKVEGLLSAYVGREISYTQNALAERSGKSKSSEIAD